MRHEICEIMALGRKWWRQKAASCVRGGEGIFGATTA